MRLRYVLVVIFVMFFIMISNVDASISYDITNMDINTNSGKITFDGWAIRVATNNYGTKLTRLEMIAEGDSGKTSAAIKLIDLNSSSNNFYPVMCVNRKGKTSSQVGSGLCIKEELSSCSAGDCIYRNVKFNAVFSIDDIIKLGSNVKFKIVINYNPNFNSTVNSSIINGGSKDTPSSEEKTIGVYNVNCKINGSQCNSDTNQIDYSKGKVTLKLENVSENAVVIDNNAKFQKETGSTFEKISDNCKLVYGSSVKIQRRINNMNYKYSSYYSGAQNFNVNGYMISTVGNGATGCGNTGYLAAYAYATWLEVDKTLTMNFTSDEGLPPQQCQVKSTKNLECNNAGYESSCDDSVSVTVRASHSETGSKGTCSGTGSASLTATYKLNQTGDLTFNLDRGPVYTGGSFTFSVDYYNRVTWFYTDRVDECPLIAIPGAKYGTRSCNCDRCCDSEGKNCHKCHCSTCKSCGTYYAYSPDCPEGSTKNLELYEKAIARTYVGSKNATMKVTMPDSNDVDGLKNNSPGEWQCGSINNLTRWRPNTVLSFRCRYVLKDAYIDKTSASVIYGNINNRNGNYISEGARYFVPLKWNDSDFDISAVFNGLSSVNGINWSGTYKCDVKCQQKLYNMLEGGGVDTAADSLSYFGSGLYLYFYRPISLSDPFPNSRQAGVNWIDWISNENNKTRLKNTYNSNNLEYVVSLGNADIDTIKTHNKNKLQGRGDGYLDYSINTNGTSNFISGYGFVKRENVDYFGLGIGVHS